MSLALLWSSKVKLGGVLRDERIEGRGTFVVAPGALELAAVPKSESHRELGVDTPFVGGAFGDESLETVDAAALGVGCAREIFLGRGLLKGS